MSAPTNPVRSPPRFVPTLTTVVELPAVAPAVLEPALHAHAAEAAPAAPRPEAALIEDLDFGPLRAAPPPAGGMVAVALSDEEALRLEEDLLHRVLQRVDLSLESRLTDTVSAAVQAQLDAMLPRLRGQIEEVLRAVVIEALAQELSETPGSAAPSGHLGMG